MSGLKIYLFVVFMLVCLHVCAHMLCAHKGQKTELAPLELELRDPCEPPGGCWKPELVPLQEEQVHLTTEPSLQTAYENFEMGESRVERGPSLVASGAG